jgi:imidazolonepropionase-like amidohydrolase
MCALTRNAFLALLVALIAAAGVQGHDQIPGAPQEAPVLLRGGDLYTISDGVLPGTDLLFENGEITAIGADLAAPAGTEIVDVSGRRVYPGLIAPLTTLGLVEIGAVRATNDLDEVGSVNPEVVAHVAFNPDSDLIPTVRTHGVTTAQVAPQGQLIRGRSSILHLDGWTKEDAAVKLVDGLVINWPATEVLDWWFLPPAEAQREQMRQQRTDLREAFEKARAYHEAREAGSEEAVDVRWEAMRSLWSEDAPVYLLAHNYQQIIEAIDFADAHDLNPVLVGGADSYRLTELLRERDIPVIIDAATELPQRGDDEYDAQFRLPARLHEAGVRFAIGLLNANYATRNLALEGAGAAIAWDLPADAALRAITLSTAEILGIADTQGSLEVGKRATLFVSSGDVTDNLGHDVTHMFIDGRSVSLDNRHRELYRKYAEKIRRVGSP